MPLLQDLARHIAEKFDKRDRIPSEVSRMMEENLAHALSYLEQAKPWMTEAENLRHRALFLEFSTVIARDLEETVREAAADMSTAVPEWLKELILFWHQHRCTVMTLNYDTLIETAAASLRVENGEAILPHHLYPPLLTDAGARSGMATKAGRMETFRLLKLHGSTNWYYSGRTLAQGEPIYFVPPLLPTENGSTREEHELRVRAVADKYPFLVPPVYDKSALFTHETIRALWFEAGEALKRADRVICMGYSLPESDLTMKHFLRTTIREDVECEVVDPSEEALTNFRRLLKESSVRLKQTVSGRDCIKQFVAALPKEPSD